METIFRKLRVILLGNAHALLDKVIDEMSVTAIQQNIRDLEAAIEELEENAAKAEGEMNTAITRMTRIQAQVDELNQNIDLILGDGDDSNDHLALPLQARLTGLETDLETAKSEVETYRQTMQAVDKIVSALKAKHQSRLAKLAFFESQDKTSKAKEEAAEAIEMASKLGDGPSVDNIAKRIETRSNIADARLRRAMKDMDTSMGEDVILADAKAKLAARKAALKAKL